MRTILAALCTALALPASAQQIESYYAWIGPEDMRNSRGVRLTTLGAILQQDRANWHRFGIRHREDEGDRLFGDRAVRARIPDLYRRGPGEDLIERIVTGGDTLGILVIVCGRRGRPEYLVVNFADGDSYNGC